MYVIERTMRVVRLSWNGLDDFAFSLYVSLFVMHSGTLSLIFRTFNLHVQHKKEI
jgi:hypothetical protein